MIADTGQVQGKTGEMPVRLVIADTMDIVCRGLPQVLGAGPGIRVVGVCSTGFELVKIAQREKPDVVLLDSEIRACTCDEAISAIHRDLPDVKILIFGWPKDRKDMTAIIHHEACGYVSRDITVEGLVRTIVLVAGGELVLSPQMANNVLSAFDGLQKKIHVRVPLLTHREREILSLVGRGQVNKDIAATLSISENTVKVHMRNVMKKVCLHTRGEAAAWLVAHY